MNRFFTLGLAAALISGLVVAESPGQANPRIKHRVNHRQTRQQLRINEGIAGGELTKKETLRLQNQQRKLANAEQRMRQSGDGLTVKEHIKLEKAQDQMSQNIYNQKHDSQSR